MPDFWPSCGFNLLKRQSDGRLVVTDDYLRLYYARPELAPVAESCGAERALHASLLERPRRAVADPEIEAVVDADARENYRIVLRFRDRMLTAGHSRLFISICSATISRCRQTSSITRRR